MDRVPTRPVLPPEIVGHIIRQLQDPWTVAACARVNHLWFLEASAVLWQGSYAGDIWTTPSFQALDHILSHSLDRLKYYLGRVRHLHLAIGEAPRDSLEQYRSGDYMAEKQSFKKLSDFKCLGDVSLWQDCKPMSISITFHRTPGFFRPGVAEDVAKVLGRLLMQGGLLGPALRVLDLKETLLTDNICGSINVSEVLCPNLRWLRGIPDLSCEGSIQCMPQLRGLSLPCKYAYEEFLLEQCRNIQYLEIWGVDHTQHTQSARLPGCFRNLRSLVLRGSMGRGISLRELLAETPVLRTLHVSGASSMFEGDHPFSCPELECASFQCLLSAGTTSEKDVLSVLSGFPRLKSLTMYAEDPADFEPSPFRIVRRNIETGNNFATVLAKATPLLEELEWTYIHCDLSASDFAALAELPNLRALNLGEVDVDLLGLGEAPEATVFAALECFEWDHPFKSVHWRRDYRPQKNQRRDIDPKYSAVLRSRMPRLRWYKIEGVAAAYNVRYTWQSSGYEYNYWHQRWGKRGPISDRISDQSKAFALVDGSGELPMDA